MSEDTKRKRQPWTQEEDETLRGMWPTEELDLIAMHLERTQGSVSGRAYFLGLRRGGEDDKRASR